MCTEAFVEELFEALPDELGFPETVFEICRVPERERSLSLALVALGAGIRRI